MAVIHQASARSHPAGTLALGSQSTGSEGPRAARLPGELPTWVIGQCMVGGTIPPRRLAEESGSAARTEPAMARRHIDTLPTLIKGGQMQRNRHFAVCSTCGGLKRAECVGQLGRTGRGSGPRFCSTLTTSIAFTDSFPIREKQRGLVPSGRSLPGRRGCFPCQFEHLPQLPALSRMRSYPQFLGTPRSL